MKSIFKLILLVAASSLTLTAVAGENSRNGHGNRNGNQRILDYNRDLAGYNCSLGSDYLNAVQYCNEDPEGMGGIGVSGYFEIRGLIANQEVLGYEEYTSYDACPDDVNNIGDGSSQSITISVGGYVVTADCTGQRVEFFSGKGLIKDAGQDKPEKYSSISQFYTTPNWSDGSCVITATDSYGNIETFGNTDIIDSSAYAYVSNYYRYNK